MKRNEITTLFEYYLSRPLCQSGMRLRSEPELGRLFNENRHKIRRALDVLVEQGYLTRRHGSGTFVRKIFPGAEAPSLAFVRERTLIMPEQLFIDAEESPRLKPVQKKQQLRIGLSADPAMQNRTNYIIFQSAKARVEELGHKAVSYSQLTYDCADQKKPDEMADELLRTRCDGYLVESWQAEQMETAFKLAFANESVPVTYFWPGIIPMRHEPVVMIDVNQALTRAVSILTDKGYRKIALLVMDTSLSCPELQIEAFQNAMKHYDLNSTNVARVFGVSAGCVPVALAALWREGVPDAIYVADDHYLPAVAEWLAARVLRPGQDIGIITLSNKGNSLPKGYEWSRMEFNPQQVGRLAVDNMVQAILSTGEDICSFAHLPTWKPGETH
jgi:DNA-binding LacI/PurR family transcriptional regulator